VNDPAKKRNAGSDMKSAQSALPAQESDYTEAVLVFDATFYLVPNAAFPITSNAVPSAVIPVAVTR
jgi:hypothetical protein